MYIIYLYVPDEELTAIIADYEATQAVIAEGKKTRRLQDEECEEEEGHG